MSSHQMKPMDAMQADCFIKELNEELKKLVRTDDQPHYSPEELVKLIKATFNDTSVPVISKD